MRKAETSVFAVLPVRRLAPAACNPPCVQYTQQKRDARIGENRPGLLEHWPVPLITPSAHLSDSGGVRPGREPAVLCTWGERPHIWDCSSPCANEGGQTTSSGRHRGPCLTSWSAARASKRVCGSGLDSVAMASEAEGSHLAACLPLSPLSSLYLFLSHSAWFSFLELSFPDFHSCPATSW